MLKYRPSPGILQAGEVSQKRKRGLLTHLLTPTLLYYAYKNCEMAYEAIWALSIPDGIKESEEPLSKL